MVYSEHIDISEKMIISKVLEDKSTYSWEAVDSEKLGDWVPDIGLTSYFNKSIFRLIASNVICSVVSNN